MLKKIISLLFIISLITGCTNMSKQIDLSQYKKATFAGGCFWCLESYFQELEGVVEVINGYTGGTSTDPTYEKVSAEIGGHYEAVEIYYDPSKLTFSDLVEKFWKRINPYDNGGQFNDRGKQYRTVIFYHNEEEKRIAEESKNRLTESDQMTGPIVTQILPAGKFYPAEEEHQDYYIKSKIRYSVYERGSGREAELKDIWK